MHLTLFQDRTEVFKTFRDAHSGVLLCTVSWLDFFPSQSALLIVSLGSERRSQCLRVNTNDAVAAKRIIFNFASEVWEMEILTTR